MKLLISVRSADEARIAFNAGADIIDVKEPDQGALGFAGLSVVSAVIDEIAGRCPVSAALGECTDWLDRPSIDALPSGLTFAKLGPAQLLRCAPLSTVSTLAKDRLPVRVPTDALEWTEQLRMTRHRFGQPLTDPPAWVAVAYADDTACHAPSPQQIMNEASESGCAGMLIDTYGKSGRSTLSILSESALQNLRSTARERGMFFALAGQIRETDFEFVREIAPDVIAVRGAACDDNNRRSGISGSKIERLRSLLEPGPPAGGGVEID